MKISQLVYSFSPLELIFIPKNSSIPHCIIIFVCLIILVVTVYQKSGLIISLLSTIICKIINCIMNLMICGAVLLQWC